MFRMRPMAEKPGRIHPGVGTGAVVVKDGALLMIERLGAHGAGTWSVPGGWVELWEDPHVAAEREVMEETGVEVKALGALGWTDSQHRDEGVHAVTLWVYCKYISGDPTVVEPEKCPRVEWVPFQEIENRKLFHPLDVWEGRKRLGSLNPLSWVWS